MLQPTLVLKIKIHIHEWLRSIRHDTLRVELFRKNRQFLRVNVQARLAVHVVDGCANVRLAEPVIGHQLDVFDDAIARVGQVTTDFEIVLKNSTESCGQHLFLQFVVVDPQCTETLQ